MENNQDDEAMNLAALHHCVCLDVVYCGQSSAGARTSA